MKTEVLFDQLRGLGITFFAGVPDSQLQPFCNYLETHYPDANWITPNEGAAVAAAAGHYLATRRIPCVYMQNSGLGNAVNPICSLIHKAVYAIPVVFVVGWRGEPGVKDEPQHVFQGQITREMLELLDIPHLTIGPDTGEEEFIRRFADLARNLEQGKSIAIVVRKGALAPVSLPAGSRYNGYPLSREEAIEAILTAAGERDVVVSSTGKISREVFEIRERLGQGHGKDFLTVGSMGHCSSIALAIACEKPDRRVICLDGDGAVLMHMGSLAMIGSKRPANLLHIVLDNHAHESVGGMPTCSPGTDLCRIALACGYTAAHDVADVNSLAGLLQEDMDGPRFIRVRVALGARADLGRPTRTPIQNRDDFMACLEEQSIQMER